MLLAHDTMAQIPKKAKAELVCVARRETTPMASHLVQLIAPHFVRSRTFK